MKSFYDMMLDLGYDPGQPIDDGRIHRFPAPDKRKSNRSAWYVFYGSAGSFGDHISGDKITWSDSDKLREEYDEDKLERVATMATERAKERNDNHKKVSDRANELWTKAKWEEETGTEIHPYLTSKNLPPIGLRLMGKSLVVPMYHRKLGGGIINLQFIFDSLEKRFMKDGETEGGFLTIGDGPPKFVCEGWATAVTIHMMTNKAVAMSFNASNLGMIAMQFRQNKPVIAADNDHKTVIRGKYVNVGLDKAMEVAQAYKLELVYPTCEGSDFNDLYLEKGEKETRRQLRMKISV